MVEGTSKPDVVYVANVRLPTEKAHGTQIMNMCLALAENGLEVELWHPRRRQQDARLSTVDAFDYYDVPRAFVRRETRNVDVVAFEDRLGRLGPATFFVHGLTWSLAAAARARRSKASLYITRHAYTALWLSRFGLPTVLELHSLPRRSGPLLLRLVKSETLALVTTTEALRSDVIAAGAPADRVVALHDAVDLKRFADPAEPSVHRERLGLPGDRALVGYVGRFETLSHGKGLDDLIRAIAMLPRATRPRLLCVGGPASMIEGLRSIGREAGLADDELLLFDRVPSKDVPAWIGACDVVVLPFPRTPHLERNASPLKLFEYMAAGRAIVATNLMSMREVLADDVNALLVPPSDPPALAGALEDLLRDESLRRRLAAQAQLDARSLSWNSRAAALLSHAAAVLSDTRERPCG